MNEFLMFDKRPKLVVEEAALRSEKVPVMWNKEVSLDKLMAGKEGNELPSSSKRNLVHGSGDLISSPNARRCGLKKKFLRREKAFERMRKKGIDVEEASEL